MKKNYNTTIENFIITGKERISDRTFEGVDKEGKSYTSTIINIQLDENTSVGFNEKWVRALNQDEVSVGVVLEWNYRLYCRSDKSATSITGDQLSSLMKDLRIPEVPKRVYRSSVFTKLTDKDLDKIIV